MAPAVRPLGALPAVSPTRCSRAVYGRRDFGVNRARTEAWRTDLHEGS